MFSKLYKKLWTKLGGRPWTYIIRDEAKAEPLVMFTLFLAAGIAIGKLAGPDWWKWLIALFAGEVLGHLFWG